jgi:hypothetical protein
MAHDIKIGRAMLTTETRSSCLHVGILLVPQLAKTGFCRREKSNSYLLVSYYCCLLVKRKLVITVLLSYDDELEFSFLLLSLLAAYTDRQRLRDAWARGFTVIKVFLSLFFFLV